jgi:hypothetical protein
MFIKFYFIMTGEAKGLTIELNTVMVVGHAVSFSYSAIPVLI